MLSIANVKAVQASNYYERDDYYSRCLTEQDTWQGKLSTQYGTSNQVEDKDFNMALHLMPNNARAAFDLTFSAPKSVSIAMVINDVIKVDMIAAHNKAVQDTLNEIEENEIEARVTKNGIIQRVKTSNLAAAKFTHFVSRNQDMQLHTHCVVLNRTDYNGKSYAISNENLYKNHILYGQLYRNRLAKNLTTMGYSCILTDPEKGFFELEGVSQELMSKFSTRRAEIVEKMKNWNADSAAAADKATLLTRKAKERKDYTLLERSWREQLGNTLFIKPSTRIPLLSEEKTAAFQAAVTRLSGRQFAFSQRELERAVLAEGCITGMDRADFDLQLKKSKLIQLGTLKRDDGNLYFTTIENRNVEVAITHYVRNAACIQHMESAPLKLRQLVMEEKLTLNNEQEKAVLHIANSNSQYVAVQGLAGTGKTYLLNAVRELYERDGWTVYGASFTGKAAEGLQAEAKIKSTTLHSFLNKLEKEAGNITDDNSNIIKHSWSFNGLKISKKPELWVIDEAGLTDNNLMFYLQQAAKLKNAKVVLVGDYQQLTPVGVGNAYSNLIQSGTISTCYLTDIRRQTKQELLAAVKESVSGSIHKSFSLISDRIEEIRSAQKRFRKISKEYTSLSVEQQGKTIVLTAKNKDRNAINQQIREDLIKNGTIRKEEEKEFTILQGVQKEEVKKKFAPNEVVIFTENNHKLGIMNGTIGKVQSISEDRMIVKINQRVVLIHPSVYRSFDYGYCVTSYKAQGMTLDRAIIHIDSEQKTLNTRNGFYVNISRARHEISIYTDSKEKICGQVSQWVKKITSDDFLINNSVGLEPTVSRLKKSLNLIGVRFNSIKHSVADTWKSSTSVIDQKRNSTNRLSNRGLHM